jgi:hypothetical protein
MDQLRALIVERISDSGYKADWLLDVYCYLTKNGASAADAIQAMDRFVDELVALKRTLELVK